MAVHLLLIALGGALGSVTRFAAATALARTVGPSFPWGTLFVNLTGCLLIGYVNGLLVDRGARPELRALFITGFLGGYTTFSAFGWEMTELLRHGQHLRAVAYVLVSNLAGFALAAVGHAASRLHA